ncbi:MAG: hypothetical protein HY706_13350 [Candidatus Hydrogenedentes bacterium]|nr:hypothetical protein [Candidatus Hydrogenedentota bacterium]
MTNRERVIASLEHRQPDKTPYCVHFTIPARAKMVEYYADPDFESKLGNCFAMLSCHPRKAWQEVGPNRVQDHFGVVWDRSVDKDIGIVANRAVTPENVESFAFPDPDNPSIWESFESAMEAEDDSFVIAQLGFSLFERAWALAGMETVLAAMMEDPPFVNRLLDRILDYNLQIIERARAYDIDGMMFGDDWGSQRGLIMGQGLWREYILPRVRQMYAAVKRRGKQVFIHCCGNVGELFPDLIDAGVDAFNPFQPEVMDVYEVKAQYGDRLSFYGGISTQRTLPYATPQETRKEVEKLLNVVGRSGGYFAAPAHAIPGDARPDKIAAMIEVLQAQ